MKEGAQYNNWKVDLKGTQKYLARIPELFMQGYTLHSIEDSDNIILQKMDKYSGIDWIAESNKRLVTVAARIQYDTTFRTFTIRTKRRTGAKTEYEKRVEAIKNGFLYPTYTCQAYFDTSTGLLDGGAIMKTVDLFESLEKSYNKSKSDNEFVYKSFTDIKEEGYSIKIVGPELPF